ncbi:MAG: methyltransferase domain-containing protein [Thermodesulfobacteriota bacterium]|nr:methyltransferase domain-containing protein [Thermodesulfobacteriota bacterium]
MIEAKDIITYYNQTHLGYRLFWGLDQAFSMHYGLADDRHQKHVDKVLNLIRHLALAVNINENDEVLDVGCGFGGSTIWLAENIGCRVTGIDINPKEINFARKQAHKRGIEDRVRFIEMDYREMDKRLGMESYSVVWQIETLIYTDRRKFAINAARLLRENGRIVIADYFARPGFFKPEEKRLLRHWITGWGGEGHLATEDEFVQYLRQAGFSDIHFENRSKDVMSSSRRMVKVGCFTTPIGMVLDKVRLRTPLQTAHSRGGLLQYSALKQGLWIYGILSGKK